MVDGEFRKTKCVRWQKWSMCHGKSTNCFENVVCMVDGKLGKQSAKWYGTLKDD